MEEANPQTSLPDLWSRVGFILLVGYCLMGRSFAYLGVPPWHLFIAEITLAIFLLAGPATILGPWTKLARRISALSRLIKIYLLLLSYGVFEVARGIALGHPPLTSLRDLAFDYYPLFLLLGLWVGLRNPKSLQKAFRLLAWFNGIYGVAYILFLNLVTWSFPGVSNQIAPVPIFGPPEFSFVILLGLLVLEPDLKAVWHLLALNSCVLLGMQVRAEWLAVAIGLLVWSVITKNFKRVIAGTIVVVLLLAIMLVTDFKIPGPQSRGGGEISTKDLVGRALAPVDPELAANYTSSISMDVGTAVWRTVWWVAIWQAVNQSPKSALLGLGYGFAIGDLVPYLAGDFIQTPHNVFFYTLGYTGWIGVFIFAFFQAELVRLLWSAYRRTGRPTGIILWAAMLSFAVFTPFFEVPQGAVPFFLILGCVLGVAIRPPKSRRVPATPNSVLAPET